MIRIAVRSASSFLSILTGAVLAAGTLLAPEPALADSFVFGFSSGDRHKHGARHHHHRHHYYKHRHYRPHYWSGYHYHYRPPVVIAPPPVVYHAPPPPVVYHALPVVSAVPSSPVYQRPDGQYCREYQGMVTVNGRSQPSYGTACLMPDGAWRVVN